MPNFMKLICAAAMVAAAQGAPVLHANDAGVEARLAQLEARVKALAAVGETRSMCDFSKTFDGGDTVEASGADCTKRKTYATFTKTGDDTNYCCVDP